MCVGVHVMCVGVHVMCVAVHVMCVGVHVMCVAAHVMCVGAHVMCVAAHVMCVAVHVMCVGAASCRSLMLMLAVSMVLRVYPVMIILEEVLQRVSSVHASSPGVCSTKLGELFLITPS